MPKSIETGFNKYDHKHDRQSGDIRVCVFHDDKIRQKNLKYLFRQ